MMQKTALVVLAAGMGSRFGGLKQMVPVGPSGETILDYSVYDALRAGFRKVVFVIRRDFEAIFRESVGRRFEGLLEVQYVFQQVDCLPEGVLLTPGREKPWGTGHAAWCAARALSEPFAVVNADDFYGADAYRRLHGFLAAPRGAEAVVACCMVGYRLAATLSEHGTVSRGVCSLAATGRLVSVEECTAIQAEGAGGRQLRADGTVRSFTGEETVSMNCWGFGPGLLPPLERLLVEFFEERGRDSKAEFYLPASVASLIAAGEAHVDVLRSAGSWFGVTYREDRSAVETAIRELVRRGEYPERLWGTGKV